MEAYRFIDNFDKVLSHFGVWPSFHDGEVRRLVLDRMRQTETGASIPTIELSLLGWVMAADAWKVAAKAVVQIVFEDVFDVELEGFNNQNVITALNLRLVGGTEQKPEAMHVELEHCFQFSCEFKACRARVVSVSPCREGDQAMA
ncbi:Imm50 family immunity protein [Xenophilus aerolatus]|nr:Imm50 family immunity protein [Xenophilus aerolatus]